MTERERDPNTISCDPRAFKEKRCDVSKPDRLGYYSKKEDRTKTISVDLNTDNAAYLDQETYTLQDELEEPRQEQLPVPYNLADGFDRYVPHTSVGNRLDNLYEWMLRTLRAKERHGRLPPLCQVTCQADVIIDRSTLSDLGMIPHYSGKMNYATELACTRIGRTVFICPFQNAEKDEHFETEEQRMNSFRQTKFAQLMTKGFKAHGKVHANKTYHHVLGTWLTNERETRKERKVIKILYPSQIYALDPSDETNSTPVEIRCERHDFEAEWPWYRKALKWYLQARFSGADKVLVGMRDGDDLVGVTELPVDWIRRTAEEKGFWQANVSFAFLHRLLGEIRVRLRDMTDGECLRVTHEPRTRIIRFAHMHTDQTFLSAPLLERYARHLTPK
ncbi:dom-3 [Aphelenchoides avenae]|nr:dom-3 [Aphelenchus avenae]